MVQTPGLAARSFFTCSITGFGRGTTVTFPNYDAVYHNVFSPSPGNTFDLGSTRAGDKPGQVALTTPGVVDVFCNIHSKMSAKVLVLLFIFIWIRGTLPRFRYDQLMRFAWTFLFPAALLNLLVTAACVALWP